MCIRDRDHIQLTCLAVGLAIVIGVPLGLLISYTKGLNKLVLGIASVIQDVYKRQAVPDFV